MVRAEVETHSELWRLSRQQKVTWAHSEKETKGSLCFWFCQNLTEHRFEVLRPLAFSCDRVSGRKAELTKVKFWYGCSNPACPFDLFQLFFPHAWKTEVWFLENPSAWQFGGCGALELDETLFSFHCLPALWLETHIKFIRALVCHVKWQKWLLLIKIRWHLEVAH